MSRIWRPSILGLVASATVLAMAGAILAGPVNSTQNPDSKNEDIEKAGAALMKGQVDEAYKLLQEAAKKNPSLRPPRLMLALLFLNSKEGVQQGRALLEQAITEHSEDPRCYLENAKLAMNDGRLSDAILNSELALKLCAADRWTAVQKKEVQVTTRMIMAAAYEQRRDWASARTQLTAHLELEKNGQLRQRLARALFFLDKTDDAFQELQQAVKDDPTLDPPTVFMAQLWALKSDSKMAREWFEKAIKAEPNNIRVHLGYCNWLLQQNEVPQAKLHADAAAKLDAESIDVLKAEGLIARIVKNLGDAENYFRRVINQSPGDFFATNQLALVLVDQSNQNQRSRGVQLAEVNARQYPRNAEALATLGYAYYRVGNLEEAGKSLQTAISPGQIAADTAYYLALLVNEKNKPEDAVKLLEPALQAKGMFVYRQEAQSLFDKLKKKEPAKDEKADKDKKQ